MSSPTEDDQESPRKGRSNAILTYEKVEEISLGIQKALLGIQYLTKQVDETQMDHEARLRVLEQNQQANKGQQGASSYILQLLWPIITAALATGVTLLINK
jgi:hypothetical protein